MTGAYNAHYINVALSFIIVEFKSTEIVNIEKWFTNNGHKITNNEAIIYTAQTPPYSYKNPDDIPPHHCLRVLPTVSWYSFWF